MDTEVAGAGSATMPGQQAEQMWRELVVELRAFVRRRIADADRADDLVVGILPRIHQNMGSLDDQERLPNWVSGLRATPSSTSTAGHSREQLMATVTDRPAEEWAEDDREVLNGLVGCMRPLLRGLPVSQRGRRRLAELLGRCCALTLAPRAKVTAEITGIINDPWVRRVISWQLTGDSPAEHRLSFDLDDAARTDLEQEVFGKRVLMTDRDHWSITDMVAGYRSQSEAEFGFRQLKDPHVVSFSPMHHWTEHNIRVHVFTCVLALQIAHLMRRHARHHGLDLSVRELLDTLAGIEETVLIYPSTGGDPAG